MAWDKRDRNNSKLGQANKTDTYSIKAKPKQKNINKQKLTEVIEVKRHHLIKMLGSSNNLVTRGQGKRREQQLQYGNKRANFISKQANKRTTSKTTIRRLKQAD